VGPASLARRSLNDLIKSMALSFSDFTGTFFDSISGFVDAIAAAAGFNAVAAFNASLANSCACPAAASAAADPSSVLGIVFAAANTRADAADTCFAAAINLSISIGDAAAAAAAAVFAPSAAAAAAAAAAAESIADAGGDADAGFNATSTSFATLSTAFAASTTRFAAAAASCGATCCAGVVDIIQKIQKNKISKYKLLLIITI
jgi:hypothetical protein